MRTLDMLQRLFIIVQPSRAILLIGLLAVVIGNVSQLRTLWILLGIGKESLVVMEILFPVKMITAIITEQVII